MYKFRAFGDKTSSNALRRRKSKKNNSHTRRSLVERLETRCMLSFNLAPAFNVTIEPNAAPPAGYGVFQDSGPDLGQVQLHSGEFWLSDADLAIPGRGIDWIFSRTYRSGVNFEGPLGHNWDFADNRRLIVVDTNTMSAASTVDPDVKVGDAVRMDGLGRADVYRKQSDGSFTAPAGFFTSLVQNSDGTLTERDAAGYTVTYAAADTNGLARMTRLADRNENTMRYQYDTGGRLERVLDTLGRAISYSYGADGHLEMITDFIGRSISFAYDLEGNLTSVTSPSVTGTSNGNDFPNGKTVTYAYSNGFAEDILNHNLLSRTAPQEVATGGAPRLIVEYESNPLSPDADRVLSQTVGGSSATAIPAGGAISYVYNDIGPAAPDDFDTAVMETTATDRNGNITDYAFNQRGNYLAIQERTNRNFRANDPQFFETTFKYNGDVQRLQDNLAEGNQIFYDLDEGNVNRFQQANVLEVTVDADVDRGGDQASIRTRLSYEPIYNQLHTIIDPRGLDAGFVPQNGGTATAPRYTTSYTFDYQEGTNFADLAIELGVSEADVQQLLTNAGIPMGLGDINGDGRTDQVAGNVIRIEHPTVTLLPDFEQAVVEGGTQQEIAQLFTYNNFGQMTSSTDPEGNVSLFEYYSERDPNGNGVIDNPSGDATTGGYLRQVVGDAVSSPQRNSGTDPTPTEISMSYEYDDVGNVIAETNGRKVVTRYEINALNQVIEINRAADISSGGASPAPDEPIALSAFGYRQRFDYDANDNVIRVQIEDRGNTSDVGIWGDVTRDGLLNASDVDALRAAIGGPAEARFDLSMDGLVDATDVRLLINNVFQTEFGDTNLDGDVDGDDLLVWKTNFGQTGTTLEMGDIDGNGRTDGRDFIIWQTNFGFDGELAAPIAWVDYSFEYDILDNLVELREEVSVDETLRTRYRLDPNENLTAVIHPVGNSSSFMFDERDLLFSGTFGALDPLDKFVEGTSGGANTVATLNDNSQTWTPNEWRGWTVYIPDGLGAGQIRRIDGNTNTQLVVATNWDVVPDSSSEYAITRTLFAPHDSVDFNVRDGAPSTFTQHYDRNGNLTEIVDAADTDGSPDNNSDKEGRGDRARFQYDGFDRLVSTVDSVGSQTVYQFDPASNVVRALDFGPTGGVSPMSDGPDVLGSPVSSNGTLQSSNLVSANLLAATEHLYDEVSRPFQRDRVLFVNSGPLQRPIDVADGAVDLGKGDLTPNDGQAIAGVLGVSVIGRVSTRSEYDRNSRVTHLVEDDGDVYQFQYDGADRQIAIQDPVGNRTELAYDDNHNLIEVLEIEVAQLASVPDEQFLTTFFFDSLDRGIVDVDNLGQAAFYQYDSRDNLVARADAQGPNLGETIARRAFAGGSLTVNEINAPGNVTLFSYDGIGRPTRQEEVLTQRQLGSTASGDGLNAGATAEGVKHLHISSSTGGNGNATLVDDQSDWTANQWLGRTLEIVSGTGAGQWRHIISNDQQTLTVHTDWTTIPDDTSVYAIRPIPLPDASQAGGDGLISTEFVWDANSLLQAVLDDQGNMTLSMFDNQDRLVAEVKGATVGTTLDYATLLGAKQIPLVDPALGQPSTFESASIDAQLATLAASLTTIAADYPPLADTIDDPTSVIYALDRDSNVTGLIDENESTRNYVFDAINRTVSLNVTRSADVTGTTVQSWQYDGLSRLVMAFDNNEPLNFGDDSTVAVAYDSLSRPIEEMQDVGGSPLYISSGFRAEGLLSSLTYPDGTIVDFSYDELDRQAVVRDRGAVVNTVEHSYIGPSRLLERRYANGSTLSFLDPTSTQDAGYDGLRRTTELRHERSDGSLIVGFQHDYDRDNNKISEEKLHAPLESELYRYDSAYRLTEFQRGELTSARDAIATPSANVPRHSQWTLDGLGNWEQVDSQQREHSNFNEIVMQDDGATTVTILLDNNGNIIDDGKLLYEWDFRNRLRTVRDRLTGNIVAEYSYDAANRRIEKVVTNLGAFDETTRYYYDGWEVLEERDENGQLLQQYGTLRSDMETLFYHENDLGSTFALTNEAGQTVEAYQYDAYGQPTVFGPGTNGTIDFGGDDTVANESTVGNPFLFTGRRFDPESGLYYFRNRYMSSELGRFISRDPIGLAGGDVNLYGYASGNPANSIDRLGLSDEKIRELQRRWKESGLDDDFQKFVRELRRSGRAKEANQWTDLIGKKRRLGKLNDLNSYYKYTDDHGSVRKANVLKKQIDILEKKLIAPPLPKPPKLPKLPKIPKAPGALGVALFILFFPDELEAAQERVKNLPNWKDAMEDAVKDAYGIQGIDEERKAAKDRFHKGVRDYMFGPEHKADRERAAKELRERILTDPDFLKGLFKKFHQMDPRIKVPTDKEIKELQDWLKNPPKPAPREMTPRERDLEMWKRGESGPLRPPSIPKTLNRVPQNKPPKIQTPPDIEISENMEEVVVITATDEDGDIPTFAITGGDDDILFDIDGETGQLSFVLPPNFEFPEDLDGDNLYEIQVQADDGRGGFATQDMLISVVNVNEPPVVLVPIEDLSVLINSPPILSYVNLNEVFEDEDAADDNLLFSIATNSNPELVTPTIRSSGELDVTIAEGSLGIAQVTVMAADSGDLGVASTFTVRVFIPVPLNVDARGSSSEASQRLSAANDLFFQRFDDLHEVCFSEHRIANSSNRSAFRPATRFLWDEQRTPIIRAALFEPLARDQAFERLEIELGL